MMIKLIASEMRALFVDEIRGMRIRIAILLILILGISTSMGVVAGRIIQVAPIQKTIIKTVVTHRIDYVKRIVIPLPISRTYPPLKDAKLACSGVPVVITAMDVVAPQEGNQNYTWLTVRPAGDPYTVQCYVEGDYLNMWHVGDLVSLTTGHLAG
jgi:hypothetical protein